MDWHFLALIAAGCVCGWNTASALDGVNAEKRRNILLAIVAGAIWAALL